MSSSFGLFLEKLEYIDAVPHAKTPSMTASNVSPLVRYDRAKLDLHDAYTEGTTQPDDIAKFIDARNDLRHVLEAIWPGGGKRGTPRVKAKASVK